MLINNSVVSRSPREWNLSHVGVPRSKWNEILGSVSLDQSTRTRRNGDRHTRIVRGTLIALSTVVWDDERSSTSGCGG